MVRITRRGALQSVAMGGAGISGEACAAPLLSEAVGYTLPRSKVVRLHSEINDVEYALYVRTPPAYVEGADRYPVIVTLDADYSFAACATHLEHMAARRRQAPEAILVSVAYAGAHADPRAYRLNRTRDYTPVFIADGGYGPEYQRLSGGAPAFLRCLVEEILPLVERRWRADPGDRTLVGHSFGGLFAGWTLQTRPDSFNRYLLISPSLWYADDLLPRTEALGRVVKPRRPTRVYLAVGDQEEHARGVGHRMVSQMTDFAEALRAREDLDLFVRHRVFEDETHASIFPAAFSTGIRKLFEP